MLKLMGKKIFIFFIFLLNFFVFLNLWFLYFQAGFPTTLSETPKIDFVSLKPIYEHIRKVFKILEHLPYLLIPSVTEVRELLSKYSN